jgi:hypothetical protein
MNLNWQANKKQTAVFFGVSTQALDGWINKGCPCEKQKRELLFYLPDVVRWRDERGEDGAKLDLTAERARLSKEQADKAEMENAKMRGELVPVAYVRELLEKVLSTFKTRILGLPTKMAPVVFGLKSITDTREALDNNLHDALNELSRINISNLRSSGSVVVGKAAAETDSESVG